MHRRIFGIENEYGVTCTFHGQRRLSPDEVARYLFRRVVSWGRSSNVFLRNGARLYLDVGSHPEYATPECDSLASLVTHDKAGERILEGLVADAEKRLHEEGIAGDIYLFKNNTDSAGNSYGCHENYLVGRHGEFSRLADVLIPFLVTRQLICGAGKVLQTPRGAVYCLSQRAEHIWEGVSSATTRSRPIINTRDEPHADAERYRRLHVIVGDSNMNELTTMLKVGSADLVLRMIEHGVHVPRPDAREPDPGDPRDLARPHRHPNGAARRRPRRVRARDPARVLQPGRRVHRAQRQRRRDRPGRRTVGTHARRGREERPVADRPRDRLGDEADPDRALPRRAPADRCPRRGSPSSTWPITTSSAAAGCTTCCRPRGAVERVATDLAIFEAKSVPPQTTRAKLRGDFIRRAQERRRDFTVDWVHLKLNDQAQRTVLCKDPYRSVDERVDKLIASM